MPVDDQAPPYIAAYLLRLKWQLVEGRPTCHLILRQIGAEEEHVFPDPAALTAFLQQTTTFVEDDHTDPG